MRLPRSLLAACVVAAAVAGCSGEGAPVVAVTAEAPAPSSPSSTSAPPAVEPSPSTEGFVEPELPAAATVPDAAGAEAFVRYWYELVNYAYASGDADALTAVSHVDCVGCRGIRENIETATKDGGVWRNLAFTPEQFEVADPDANGISLATALLVRTPDPTVLMPDGEVVAVTGAEVESVRFWAQWTGDRWQTFAINHPDRPS